MDTDEVKEIDGVPVETLLFVFNQLAKCQYASIKDLANNIEQAKQAIANMLIQWDIDPYEQLS